MGDFSERTHAATESIAEETNDKREKLIVSTLAMIYALAKVLIRKGRDHRRRVQGQDEQ